MEIIKIRESTFLTLNVVFSNLNFLICKLPSKFVSNQKITKMLREHDDKNFIMWDNDVNYHKSEKKVWHNYHKRAMPIQSKNYVLSKITGNNKSSWIESSEIGWKNWHNVLP